MMNFDNIEKNTIHKFWKTLSRKNISNIETNNFLKKPYLEKYIIDMSMIINNDQLDKKILEKLDSNEITNEEILLFISNIFEIDNDNKKNIEKAILKNPFYDEDINNLSINIIHYQVKYFRFYQLIHELLFDKNSDENELYNFILVYIKNNKRDINLYLKKNINFKIFYTYLNELFEKYDEIYCYFIENNYINKTADEYNGKSNILNMFLKNIFTNWYNIYKNDILNNNVNDKIKEHIIKRGILSRLTCFSNA
jgi:hypothetical protein